MKSALITASIVLTSLGAASLAHGQCATVDPVIIPQIRVDPLAIAGPGELVEPFVLTFRRAVTDTRSLAIRYQIVDEDSSVHSRIGEALGPTVEWQSPDSQRDIGAFRSEVYSLLKSSRVVLGEKEQTARSNVTLHLTNPGDDLSSGVYREQFTVRYWCDEADTSHPYDSRGVVTASAAVPNVLSANIAGASVRGEIEFMDFAILSRSLQISVRSTGPYSVTARSLNGGVLLRERGGAGVTAGDEADRIRYVAAFDGQPLTVDLSTSRSMPRAGTLGRQISLDVNVEPVKEKRAGVYSDTLLMTLSPAN